MITSTTHSSSRLNTIFTPVLLISIFLPFHKCPAGGNGYGSSFFIWIIEDSMTFCRMFGRTSSTQKFIASFATRSIIILVHFAAIFTFIHSHFFTPYEAAAVCQRNRSGFLSGTVSDSPYCKRLSFYPKTVIVGWSIQSRLTSSSS